MSETRNSAGTPGLSSTGSFRGEMELLERDYEKRFRDIMSDLEKLSETELAEAGQLKEGLISDRELIRSAMEYCKNTMVEMEAKVRAGLLSLLDEKVCADVAEAELLILNKFTQLQRYNSASLGRVFALDLPARAKSLDKDAAAGLRTVIAGLMECSQFISNTVQDLAIRVKERNKVITHPLDEDHPE